MFLCDTLLGAGMQNSLKPVCQRHGRSQKADKSGMLSSALGHHESRGMGRGEQVNWMFQKHPWRGWGFMLRLEEHKRSVGRAKHRGAAGSLLLWLCVCIVCVGGCVYARVHVHVEGRGRLQVSLLRCHPSFYVSRQGLLPVWYSPSRLQWLANEPQESACPCLPALRL